MGQKVNPVGFRTGVMRGWSSRWYAPKDEFATLLVEDKKLRDFIKKHPTKNYKNAGIDRIEIERTRDEVKVILHVARPGLIIGKKGQEVELLQEELQNLIGRRINLKIEEISRPEMQAQLVAPRSVDADRIEAIAAGEALTRNLINTPAADMGPPHLEQAVRDLAKEHGADVRYSQEYQLLQLPP